MQADMGLVDRWGDNAASNAAGLACNHYIYNIFLICRYVSNTLN